MLPAETRSQRGKSPAHHSHVMIEPFDMRGANLRHVRGFG